MAEPIPFAPPPRDPREALYHRLETAPQEHVEALLATYDVLQGLHDRGVLELAKGALGSGDKILEILVNAADTPEVLRGIRNFIILTKLFATLDPELLEHLAETVPKVLVEAKAEKPLGPLQLMSKMTHEDTRRILTIMTKVLETLGKELGSRK